MLPSTLDMVPSTLDMEPSTLDPRQKDRLAQRDSLPLFGRSKFSSRSAKLTSSLVGNVIVYISPFSHFFFHYFLLSDTFQTRFPVGLVIHLCPGIGFFTTAMTYQLSKYLPFQFHQLGLLHQEALQNKQLANIVFYFPNKEQRDFHRYQFRARFCPKSTCTVDTTIYQTQVRMFFKAHSLGI